MVGVEWQSVLCVNDGTMLAQAVFRQKIVPRYIRFYSLWR